MSNRGGFLEGLIVGALLGGLSVLDKLRRQLQNKFQQLRSG